MAEPESKTWSQQLAEFVSKSGKTASQVAREMGFKDSTFRDYVSGRQSKLESISPERRKILYLKTRLECFKTEDSTSPATQEPNLDSAVSELFKLGRDGVERIVTQLVSQLNTDKTSKLALLKAKLYHPSAEQRTSMIMELLDVLCEEVDYFRTSPAEETKVLVDRLQKEPASFGYVTQMLNVIYGGKAIDSWMRQAQPPSKLKKMMREVK